VSFLQWGGRLGCSIRCEERREKGKPGETDCPRKILHAKWN